MNLKGKCVAIAVAGGVSMMAINPAQAQSAKPVPQTASKATTQPAASPAGQAVAPARRITPSMQTARILANINADAVAILNAIQWDPALGGQLEKNPAGGSALLKTRGAVRSERIVVEKATGAQAAITVSLSIGNVRTVFTLPVA